MSIACNGQLKPSMRPERARSTSTLKNPALDASARGYKRSRGGAHVFYKGRWYTFEIREVTPEMAANWLATNNDNRPKRIARIDRLAKRIKDGKWMFNGQTVIFSRKGKLQNGQHRLHACVRANQPIEVAVLHGIADAAFKTMDTGVGRTGADMLSIEKYKNSKVLQGVAGAHHRYTNGGLIANKSQVEPDLALEIVQDNPGMADSAEVGASLRAIMPRHLAGFCHFEFSLKDPRLANDFFEKLKEGCGLSADHAVWVLRERLLSLKGGNATRTEPYQVVALTIKAWNAFKAGKPLNKNGFKFSKDNEAFPTID